MTVFAGDWPRRPIWTADLTYWMSGQKQAGRADPGWATEAGYLALHRDLGVRPYYDYEHFWAGIPRYDETVQETWVREGRRTLHRIQTPAGVLEEEHLDLPDSACSGCVRHFVQTAADLAVLRDLLERRRLEPANLDDYPDRMARWAALGGLPCLGLPRSPLASFCYEWAGVETAAFLLADESDSVREILARMEAQEAPILEAVCRLRPLLVHFPDNLDSETLTGWYDEGLGPGHRRRLDRLHAAGIRAAVHLDGAVRGLLPRLSAVGFDAVEALTPAPCGDVEVAEMARLANPETILWGGVPGAMFAPPYTWPEMRRHLDRLRQAWRGRRFVLGVADQVPPDGQIDFCRRISDWVEEQSWTN